MIIINLSLANDPDKTHSQMIVKNSRYEIIVTNSRCEMIVTKFSL